MILSALLSLLASTATPPRPPAATETTEVTIAQSVIIRVPAHRSRRYRPADAPPQQPKFKEHRGPRCIDAAQIGGAAVTAPDAVDFILKGGKRIRARLQEECPALDYYSGFYVLAPADGKICADRDSIRTRSGGNCQVDRFRLLTPVAQPK